MRVDKAHLDAQPGDTVRLRLINAVVPDMDGGPETPVLIGAPATVTALDGHELHQPQPLGPTRIPLGMGQRADLVFRMPAAHSVQVRLAELRGQPALLERLLGPFLRNDTPASESVTVGSGPAPQVPDLRSTPVFDLATHGTPLSQAAARFDAVVPLVLDKKPGMRDGRPELVHTINGQAAPYVPALQVTQGQRVLVHFVNNTDEYHPMHVHGHVFDVVAQNGEPLSGSPVELDTLLVGPHETWDAAFTADNPGVWMIHCHALIHAGFGMAMTVNYAGVYTPFEMGEQSSNMPE